MEPNILVTWATRAGCASEVAGRISDMLKASGVKVDLKPVQTVRSLDGYTAVIIGGGVRAGKLYGEIVSFVRNNKDSLAQIPVACFVTCMTMKEDTLENRAIANTFLDPIRQYIQPVDTGLFAGAMDYSKLGFLARFAVKNMVKVPEGDHRDWNAIEAWVKGVAPKLTRSSVQE